ncbi:hypothetical protein SmJEL517_g03209 [Synchytrium microbalum]|uniref:Uncharacterized protein n=1 Tax=Synchytrium microbalum TaxID=1806994 RepID=A0A507C2M3_9FUNG|nr:uncharacterized protein SmJEL517_g03209 [Synchytrium microbalum]TPX33982.1 hypothetical protein SmJEL517_g03209 [Synchytrium microbalum]
MKFYGETHIPLQQFSVTPEVRILPDPNSSWSASSARSHSASTSLNVLSDVYHPATLPRSIIVWMLTGASREYLELRFIPIAQDSSVPSPSGNRMLFKAPHSILPGVLVSEDADTFALNVLFVTSGNVFYRLTFPAPLWFEASSPDYVFHQTIEFEGIEQTEPLVAHFVNTNTVMVGYANGHVAKLECARNSVIATKQHTHVLKEEAWTERFANQFGNNPLVKTLKTLAFVELPPRIHEVAAVASLIYGDNLMLGFVLGQDRKLRVWNLLSNTLAQTIVIPSSTNGGDHKASATLSNGIGHYIQIFDEEAEVINNNFQPSTVHFKLAVMIPQSPNPFLAIYGGIADISVGFKALKFIKTMSCEPIQDVAGDSFAEEVFVDFRIIKLESGFECWTLWELRGEAVIRHAPLALSEQMSGVTEERWISLPSGVNEQRFAPSFTTTVSAQAFLDYAFYPGRFSKWVIEQALVEYESNSRRAHASQPTSFITLRELRERVAITVGGSIRLQLQNDINEHRMLEAYQQTHVEEWNRFLHACTSLQRSGAHPTALSVRPQTGAIAIVRRGGVGLLRELDTAQLIAGPNAISPTLFALLPSTELQYDYPELESNAARSDLTSYFSILALIKEVIPAQSLNLIHSELVKALSLKVSIGQHLVDVAQQHLAPIVGNSTLRARIGSIAIGMSSNTEFWTRLTNIVSREVPIPEPLPTSEETFRIRLGWMGMALVEQALNQAIASRAQLCFDMMLVLMTITASAVKKRSQVPTIMMVDGLRLFQTYALLAALTGKMVRIPEFEAAASMTDPRRPKALIREATRVLVGQFADMRVKEDSQYAATGDDLESFLFQVVRLYMDIPINIDNGSLSQGLRAAGIMSLSKLQQPTLLMKLGCSMAANVDVIGTMVQQLPPTRGSEYLAGLCALTTTDYEKARARFLRAASVSDNDDLTTLLPPEVQPDGIIGYYRHIASLLAPSPEHAIIFVQAALDEVELNARDGPSAISLLKSLFTLNLSILRFEEAFHVMQSIQDEEARLGCLSVLVYDFCEKRQVEALFSGRLAFSDMEAKIEELLWFKAQNSPVWPQREPPYYKILYSYYTYRGNHRGAASAMFQYSRRLSELSIRSDSHVDIPSAIEERARALLVSIQSLQLAAPEFGWITIPKVTDKALGRPAKRRRLTTFTEQSELPTLEAVSTTDLTKEYELTMVRLVLSDKFPALVTSNETIVPETAVALCCEAGYYDNAFTIGKLFELDLSGIFASLATRCVRLYRDHRVGSFVMEGASETWEGTPADKLMKLTRSYLELHDTPSTGYQYRRLFIDRLLSDDWQFTLPLWLTQFYEVDNDHKHRTHLNAEDMIRIYLKHGRLMEAVKLATRTVERELQKGGIENLPVLGRWLPYAIFDQLEEYARESKRQNATATDAAALSQMRRALDSYMKKVAKENENVRAMETDLMSVNDVVQNVLMEANRR